MRGFSLDRKGEPQLKAIMGKDWPRCEAEWDRFFGFAREHAPAIDDPLLAYYFLLTNPHTEQELKEKAAHRWNMLESVAGDLHHTPQEIEHGLNASMTPKHQLSRAIIENNWIVRTAEGAAGFFAQQAIPNSISSSMAKLRRAKTRWKKSHAFPSCG